MMLTATFANASIYRGYDILIILSFAGANFKDFHNARHDPYLFTNFFISGTENLVSINTSTASHVAAGDVIDFEKVFGENIHNDPKIGTMIIVVSFHGTHHIQYFTAVSFLNFIISHI
jgi:hypothetical protein